MYGDLAGLKAYWAARGNAAVGAADDTSLEQALLRASDYIALAYLPRLTVPDPVPDAFAYAEYEAAALELGSPGFFNPSASTGSAAAKTLTEVAGIKWTVTSAETTGTTDATEFPVSAKIEAYLRPYFTGTAFGMGVMSA